MTSDSEKVFAENQLHCWEFFSLVWLNPCCKNGKSVVGSTKNDSVVLLVPLDRGWLPQGGTLGKCFSLAFRNLHHRKNTHPRGTKLVVTPGRPSCLAEAGIVPIGGHVPCEHATPASLQPPSLSLDELQSRDGPELQWHVLHLLLVLMGSGNLSTASVSSSAKGADSFFH